MRQEYSGWFVEVPSSLKRRFKELYPGRSAQRKITLAAIEWAIKSHPSNNKDGYEDENRQLRSVNASELPSEVSTSDEGRMDKQA